MIGVLPSEIVPTLLSPTQRRIAVAGRIAASTAGPLAVLALFLPFARVDQSNQFGQMLFNAFSRVLFGRGTPVAEAVWVAWSGWRFVAEMEIELRIAMLVFLAALVSLSLWWWRGGRRLQIWRAAISVVAFPLAAYAIVLCIALTALLIPIEWSWGFGLFIFACAGGAAGAAADTAARLAALPPGTRLRAILHNSAPSPTDEDRATDSGAGSENPGNFSAGRGL
jgi:hypothetical protein